MLGNSWVAAQLVASQEGLELHEDSLVSQLSSCRKPRITELNKTAPDILDTYRDRMLSQATAASFQIFPNSLFTIIHSFDATQYR
jgi:hypothetical protein